jgi:hypothetical protein
MAGGLLQIVSATKEDIFLTIDPQITFFKIVYLKYSNFAIETLEETFDGYCNFGEEVVCNISKNGDLIHNMYLKIELPKVLIPRLTSPGDSPAVDSIPLSNFNTFSKPLFSLWRKLYANINIVSSNFNTIQTTINNFVASDEYQLYNPYRTQFRSFRADLSYNFDIIHTFEQNFVNQYKNSIYDPNDTVLFKNTFKSYLINFKHEAQSYKTYLINFLKTQQTNNDKTYSPYYRFGWVDRIGLRLIDQITFELGGQKIDTLTSDTLNIYHQLFMNENHREVYDKMIGHVAQLTTYSSEEHPNYTLYIPIPFWFSRYHGAALPCVALRYQDIQVSVRFRDINDCCFFEPYENSLLDDMNLAEQVQLVNASLLIDYVYLDIDEKNKYGNSNLEYLIEQHQYLTYYDFNIKKFNTSLTFVNPVKEIAWVTQLNSNIRRYKAWDQYHDVNIGAIAGISEDASGIRISVSMYDVNEHDRIRLSKTRFYDGDYHVLKLERDSNGLVFAVYIRKKYVATDTGHLQVIRPNSYNMEQMQLITNGVELTPNVEPSFFNTLMAYKRHTNSPTDNGVYMYSFALQPELFQPTGSCNMSLLTSNDIYFIVKDELIDRIKKTKDRMTVKVFAKSLNILGISRGISHLEFSV